MTREEAEELKSRIREANRARLKSKSPKLKSDLSKFIHKSEIKLHKAGY